jgi:hypothetical protein
MVFGDVVLQKSYGCGFRLDLTFLYYFSFVEKASYRRHLDGLRHLQIPMEFSIINIHWIFVEALL